MPLKLISFKNSSKKSKRSYSYPYLCIRWFSNGFSDFLISSISAFFHLSFHICFLPFLLPFLLSFISPFISAFFYFSFHFCFLPFLLPSLLSSISLCRGSGLPAIETLHFLVCASANALQSSSVGESETCFVKTGILFLRELRTFIMSSIKGNNITLLNLFASIGFKHTDEICGVHSSL